MGFFSQHIIPPTEHYLDLLQFITVLTYSIHLPYIGMVIGGVGAAMWFTLADSDHPNPRYERFAGDLLKVFLGNRVAIVVLGILPIFVISLTYIQWFVGADATPLRYIPWMLVPVVLGFAALSMYRRSFASRRNNIRAHLGLGSIGISLLLAGYFILMAILCRLQDPEKWFRVVNLGNMLLNWNAIWKFLFFMHASFALSGAAILFFFYKWPGTRVDTQGAYDRLVRNFGAGMAFAFSLAVPVFYTFYIFTTADVAFDNTVYLMAVTVVFLVLVGALMLFSNIRATATRFASAAFVVFLAAFVLVSVVDKRAMSNANAEHKTGLVLEAKRLENERQAELEALAAGTPGAGRGEEIFNGQCMACHRFDTKLVGPPLQETLPKYRDDIAALRKYIKNPWKISDDYPPMPSLGLSDTDVEAVATYVLEQLDELQQAPGVDDGSKE